VALLLRQASFVSARSVSRNEKDSKIGSYKHMKYEKNKWDKMFEESKFEKFMWGVFPYIFWIMFLGILLMFFIKAYLMIFYPRFIGEWNAELLAPIIEKIKE
jgi:hypothetical protein